MVDKQRAIDDLYESVRLLGGEDVTITSDRPAKGKSFPDDPGVAVYFFAKNKEYAVAVDQYFAQHANIRAIGLTIDALRSLDRYGTNQLVERAMAGFDLDALPAGAPRKRPWFEVLGVFPNHPIEVIEAMYKTLAKQLHPDRPTGDKEKFQELQEAITEARKERS